MANSETLPSKFVPRSRKVRILATLGPASRTPEMIRKLAEAGADAFRVNMSHGTHKDHAQLIETIRTLEKELDRPRSEEHTSELQSQSNLVCRLLLEKKKKKKKKK